MKRFLLATAAVVTLAFAVPMAVAQNTTSQPTYTQTTPAPVASQTTLDDQSVPPQTQSEASPSMTTPDAMPMQSTAQADTNSYSDDRSDAMASQQADASDIDQGADQMATTSDPQNAARADQFAAATVEPATLQEAALEAGMAGTPMNAAEVCATRDVDLGSSRLTHDSRQQLRFAADRASACEIDQVVISAPRGREEAVRQVLISHGVDAADIQVQEASELGVEMRFAGVATSSEYFASIFNPNQQLAMNDTATTSSSYAAPTTPNATWSEPDAMSAPDTTTTNTDPVERGADDPDAAESENTTL